MLILLARKKAHNFRSEMSNFFDEPRQMAGFHIFIWYIKVFNKPQQEITRIFNS